MAISFEVNKNEYQEISLSQKAKSFYYQKVSLLKETKTLKLEYT